MEEFRKARLTGAPERIVLRGYCGEHLPVPSHWAELTNGSPLGAVGADLVDVEPRGALAGRGPVRWRVRGGNVRCHQKDG